MPSKPERRDMPRKILVIEDDWNFQALITVFLAENGFAVESADSGKAGLKKALCSRPDLILLDYNLGDMNGQEAAFWLEYMKGTRGIPVLLLTALGGDPEIAGPLSKSPVCRGILCKSRPLSEVLEKINSVLHRCR